MKKKKLKAVLSLALTLSLSATMLPTVSVFAEDIQRCECDHPGMDQNGNIVSEACASHVPVLDLFKVCDGYTFDANSVKLDKSAKTITFTDFTIKETDQHRDNCVAKGYKKHKQYDGDPFGTKWGRILAVSSDLLDGYTLVFDGNCEFDDIHVCGEEEKEGIKIKVTTGSTLTLTNFCFSRPETRSDLSLADGTVCDKDFAIDTGKLILTGTDKKDDAKTVATDIVESAKEIDEKDVSTPKDSNVVIDGVSSVDTATEEACTAYIEELVNKIYEATGVQTNAIFANSMLFDLKASGSGTVQFYVGTRHAGKIVIVTHCHDQKWTVQQCVVSEDGYVYPKFANFSPIGIFITNQTQRFNLEDTEPAVVNTNAVEEKQVSPKTGDFDGFRYMMVLLLGAVMLVAGFRQMNQTREK